VARETLSYVKHYEAENKIEKSKGDSILHARHLCCVVSRFTCG